MVLKLSYPDLSAHPDFDNHEKIVLAEDPDIDFRAYIAIYNTNLGFALGGCRYRSDYETEEEAQADVLRLSKGMTYKNALGGLQNGGGKSLIVGPKGTRCPAPDMMRALGKAIDSLGGEYVTAEDVGTCEADMCHIAEETKFVSGITPESDDISGGDPSPYTAYGVFVAIKEAVNYRFGKNSLENVRVAVKGLGNVAMPLCEMLHDAGASLVVADIDPEKIRIAADKYDALISDPEKIIREDVDVYCPCALGGDLNDDSIPDIKAKIIAGSANNQLAEPRHGKQLSDNGVLYVPDFVANAGGVVSVALIGHKKDDVLKRLDGIGDTLGEIFRRSAAENTDTATVADKLAAERFMNADNPRKKAGPEFGIS
jgi:leucine dehydrogenase